MDPESKKLLQDTFALAQENNKILHSMRRSMRVARAMSIIYWLFIIGSAIGAYYLVQPYLEQVMDLYGGASDTLNNLKNFSS